MNECIEGTGIKASPTLVNVSYLKSEKTGFYIDLYENSCQFTNDYDTPRDRPPCWWRRKRVNQFSHASRKRLMRIFSRVRYSELTSPIFVTLTYHFIHRSQGFRAQKHLNVFMQFLRDTSPHVAYMWRVEMQKRGAPHFHLVLWSTDKLKPCDTDKFCLELKNAWHRISQETTRAHIQYGVLISKVQNQKHAFRYISKYVAKEDEHIDEKYTGRRWGYSRNLPIAAHCILTVSADAYKFLRKIAYDLLVKNPKISSKFLHYVQTWYSCFFYLTPEFWLQYVRFDDMPRSLALCADAYD